MVQNVQNAPAGRNKLGILGTLALYSQYILIAALIIGAAVLKLSAR